MKEQTENLSIEDLLKECKALKQGRDKRVLELACYARQVAEQYNHREAQLKAMYESALAVSSIEGNYRESNQMCAQLLDVFRPPTDPFLSTLVYRLMGTNYYYLGQYKEASD
jgi:sensor histidine kinase regulating citrate/malate metabolism